MIGKSLEGDKMEIHPREFSFGLGLFPASNNSHSVHAVVEKHSVQLDELLQVNPFFLKALCERISHVYLNAPSTPETNLIDDQCQEKLLQFPVVLYTWKQNGKDLLRICGQLKGKSEPGVPTIKSNRYHMLPWLVIHAPMSENKVVKTHWTGNV